MKTQYINVLTVIVVISILASVIIPIFYYLAIGLITIMNIAMYVDFWKRRMRA